ncbi:MAG: helix-turn-helix domain-containing protein [Treponema sp.]|nr:helix-turn-helix domain-containing protein [Treponema sp.]
MTSEEFEDYINTLPGVLSIRGAASFFRVHPMTVLRLIRKGELKAKKDANGQWAIKRADIASYCSSHSNL